MVRHAHSIRLSQVADDMAIELQNPYNRTGNPYHAPKRVWEEPLGFGVHKTQGFVFFVETEIWHSDEEVLGFDGYIENERHTLPRYRTQVVFGD